MEIIICNKCNKDNKYNIKLAETKKGNNITCSVCNNRICVMCGCANNIDNNINNIYCKESHNSYQIMYDKNMKPGPVFLNCYGARL